jgi:nucleoid-associated protein YgaU
LVLGAAAAVKSNAVFSCRFPQNRVDRVRWLRGKNNMAITPLKAFLFAVGGSVAAAGVAYVSGALDPYLNPPPADVASLSQPATPEQAPATSTGTQPRLPAADSNAMAPAADAMKPAAPEGDDGGATQPAPAGVVAPTFDVVRVEGNGSVVIAGNAAPNAKVEIVHGSTVLGETTAGADGAFAIVLDDPLKPGDYQIVLRSTAPDNVVATSTQTAVVSVPEQAGGQVLAMVEEPGKPAELLTVPKPEAQAETPQAQPGATEAPISTAPAAPSATGNAAAPETPVTPVPGAKVVVEAVEIDGSKVFIAGLADPGRKVRAYANEILLGDAVTSPDGHFLIEAARDLPVGEYTIRVDGLDADGAKVVVRATVPFQREPGESIAAVAPAAPATTETKPAETAAAAPATAPAASGEQKPAETAAAAPTEAPATTVAPKLEHVDSAVIIRRGDTLWRISRRVYGHGVRYSTIYLANQEQIADPDRIWPGQVFKVPEKSKEGEAADYKAMGDQITTNPAQQQ